MPIDDVLSVISSEEFDMRYVAWRMNGVCMGWQQTSMIISEIHNAVTRNIYAKSKQSVPESSWSDWLSFLPSWLKRKPKDPGGIKVSDPDAGERAAAMLGIG